MTAFVIVAGAMLLIACAWVLVPLVRRRRAGAIAQEASNLAVLRDQRAELEADLGNGVISPAQYEATRAELDRRVLEETRAAEASAFVPERSGMLAAVLVATVMPIAAVGMYLLLGTPAALSPDTAKAAAAQGDAQHSMSPGEIESMIERVKAKLAQEPDNLEGWVVLARTYYVLGRGNEAAGAFERATALAPDDADLLADYADALGVAQGRSLEGKPAAAIERALKANPAHWKANALAGTLAFHRKQYAKAVEYWERVKASVPPDSPVAQSIQGSIAEARQLAGMPAGKAPPPLATAPAPPKPTVAGALMGARIAGTVSIAPLLAAGVSPDDAVFIFARPAGGSRMPLALMQRQVKDLPLAFTLDDSMAMSPAMKLSDHGEVIVGARVSRSGSAMPQSGDLEGLSTPVKLGASGLALVIDRRLP